MQVPDRAQVVIVGGGIAGASIAYHLAERGISDIAVIEQGELVSGTTSHAPGLVGQLRSSVSLTKMLMYSVSLYRDLQVDGVPGYFPVGGIRLASSRERLEEIKQQAKFAAGVGLAAELITAREAGDMFPLMSMEGVEGALYLPDDGSATAPVLARALISKAQQRGVKFYPNTQVRSIKLANQRISGIETTAGTIETETLVLASGIWSPLLGKMAGVSIPLIPMQHQYAVSNAIPELSTMAGLPNLRDPDNLVYYRQREQSLIIGGYERNPKPWQADNIGAGPDPTVKVFDANHFEPLRRAAAVRVPCLGDSGFSKEVNGLESFTPDGEFLVGPSTEVKGLWVACGFCAHGVSGSGGVGKMIADWIVDGQPALDLSEMAPDRFGPQGGDPSFIEQGAVTVYSTYYDLRQPAKPVH